MKPVKVEMYGNLAPWTEKHVESALSFQRKYGLAPPSSFDEIARPFEPTKCPIALYDLRRQFMAMLGLYVYFWAQPSRVATEYYDYDDAQHASALLALALRDVGIVEPSGGFILTAPTYALHIKHDGAWLRNTPPPQKKGRVPTSVDAWTKREVFEYMREGATYPTLTWQDAFPQRWTS